MKLNLMYVQAAVESQYSYHCKHWILLCRHNSYSYLFPLLIQLSFKKANAPAFGGSPVASKIGFLGILLGPFPAGAAVAYQPPECLTFLAYKSHVECYVKFSAFTKAQLFGRYVSKSVTNYSLMLTAG